MQQLVSRRALKRLKAAGDELYSQLESITSRQVLPLFPYRSRYGARDARLIISLRPRGESRGPVLHSISNYCAVNKEDYGSGRGRGAPGDLLFPATTTLVLFPFALHSPISTIVYIRLHAANCKTLCSAHRMNRNGQHTRN